MGLRRVDASSAQNEKHPGGPVVYRRRVRWGEGDPAHIAYTVRFLDFVMEAIEEWFREVLGVDWYELNLDLGMGSPVVHLELDFSAPVKPGDVLEIPVLVQRLGGSSITFELRARLAADASERFRALMVHSLVDNQRMKAIPFPPDFRARIENYIRACGESVAEHTTSGSDPTPPGPGP